MNFLYQLLMPWQLISWSTAFYFSHPMLIAVAVVPAFIRAVQMLDDKYLSSMPVEALVGISRVVLVFAIIGVGKSGGLVGMLSGQILAESFYQASQYTKGYWREIILQLILFAVVFGLINLLIAYVAKSMISRDSHSDLKTAGNRSSRRAKAVLFVIKNVLVIPIGLIYLFRIFRII